MARMTYQEEPVEHVRLRDGVVVVAVDDDSRVALVRHTNPLHGETLSVPGGLIEEGERPQEAAERELAEEAGISAVSWALAAEFVPVPYSTQHLFVFLAMGLTIGRPQLEQHEIDARFRLEWWPYTDAIQSVREGHVHLSGSALALLLIANRVGASVS